MIAVAVTIPDIGKTRRFVSPNEAHMQATLAKSCYGDPATRIVETSVIDQTPERLARAWAAADAFAQAGMDNNSRFSMLDLDRDPECPVWRRERIAAVKAWWAAIWQHYAAVRAGILAGSDVAFDSSVPGPCPWTIWHIVELQTPTLSEQTP